MKTVGELYVAWRAYEYMSGLLSEAELDMDFRMDDVHEHAGAIVAAAADEIERAMATARIATDDDAQALLDVQIRSARVHEDARDFPARWGLVERVAQALAMRTAAPAA